MDDEPSNGGSVAPAQPVPSPPAKPIDAAPESTTWAMLTMAGVALLLIAYLAIRYGPISQGDETNMPTTWYLITLVAVLGTVALVGVFTKMKRGIGPHNLRAIGIVFVAVLVSLLAVSGARSESALGILGAIVGYLFGKDTSNTSPRP